MSLVSGLPEKHGFEENFSYFSGTDSLQVLHVGEVGGESLYVSGNALIRSDGYLPALKNLKLLIHSRRFNQVILINENDRDPANNQEDPQWERQSSRSMEQKPVLCYAGSKVNPA